MTKNGQHRSVVIERELYADRQYSISNIFEKVLGEADTWNEIL